MDAKVGDWVVTPRRGKAVEINALWYNALRLMAGLAAPERRRRGRRDRRPRRARRRLVQSALLARRKSAISTTSSTARPATIPPSGRTRFSPCRSSIRCSTRRAGSRWSSAVHDRLLTPLGLRSLAPGEPDYKPRYFGDLRARDAAYHQGTVWAWLIGPFIDAWLRVHPGDLATARGFLDAFEHAYRRGGDRLDQRDFRCRGAVHAARLHRPGLERRRGAAVAGQDGRTTWQSETRKPT